MKDQLKAVAISLEIEGQRALFVLLSADGAINRMGSGAVDNEERDLFIGQIDGELFEQLMAAIPEEIFEFAGSYEVKERHGADCWLRLHFDGPGSATGFEFHYGAESEGPPREIVDIVRRAVELTTPWFEAQQAMATNAEQG